MYVTGLAAGYTKKGPEQIGALAAWGTNPAKLGHVVNEGRFDAWQSRLNRDSTSMKTHAARRRLRGFRPYGN
jgi:hypothetical protein